jgi:hypothetical protein
MGAPRTTRSTFRRSRAVGLGDVAHRLRGDGLRRASQGPCPLDNLGRLIANHYLEGRLRVAFFVQLPRLETRQVHAPGLSIAKPRCLRVPRLSPQARGSFWPRASIVPMARTSWGRCREMSEGCRSCRAWCGTGRGWRPGLWFRSTGYTCRASLASILSPPSIVASYDPEPHEPGRHIGRPRLVEVRQVPCRPPLVL